LSEGRALPSIPELREHDRPAGFGNWPAPRKLEYLFGSSLEMIEEVLAWDNALLDRHTLRIKKEVATTVLMIGAKFGLSRARASDELALAEVRAGLKKHRGESK
jgi:hypothetical protein